MVRYSEMYFLTSKVDHLFVDLRMLVAFGQTSLGEIEFLLEVGCHWCWRSLVGRVREVAIADLSKVQEKSASYEPPNS